MLVAGFQIGAPHFGHTLTLMNDIESPMLFNSMGNSSKLVETFIRRTVKEEIDKALAVSDKRRKEFQDGFGQVFTEADAAQPPVPPDPNAPPPDPNAPAAPPPADPAAAGAPPAGDPNAPAPEVDPATGEPVGGAGGVPGGDPADPDAPVDGEEGADAGSGGGGGGLGGFGGGGGGGGGDDMGDGSEAPEEAESGAPETPQGDPIVAMLSGAQELLNQTQDPNLILKSLKGQIQTLFQQPEHALGLVKALYDTQDSLLQAVAQRLYLFIKTSRPQ